VTARLTPVEFGESLQRARLEAKVTLEAICERTKISVRVLSALESGEFSKLPNRTFARMFLRQFLECIHAEPAEWITAFDRAWQHFLDSTQPSIICVQAPPQRRRIGPWVIGLCLVAGAVAAVLLVEHRDGAGFGGGSGPSPTALAALTRRELPSPPTPTQTPAPSLTPQAPRVVIRTLDAPCWVEVHVDGEQTASRLLPPSSQWEVETGGRGVDVVLGDAGAASVEYLGQVRNPVGSRGEVARLHLDGVAPPVADRR
jgi:cytoskeleton protein RodZ